MYSIACNFVSIVVFRFVCAYRLLLRENSGFWSIITIQFMDVLVRMEKRESTVVFPSFNFVYLFCNM